MYFHPPALSDVLFLLFVIIYLYPLFILKLSPLRSLGAFSPENVFTSIFPPFPLTPAKKFSFFYFFFFVDLKKDISGFYVSRDFAAFGPVATHFSK